MITISLVADDENEQTLVRHSLRSDKLLHFLSAYPTAEEALTYLPKERPNVALIDVKLPGMDGIE